MPTSRRIARIAQVLHRRQPEIVLALDGVHDSHNISAILRSADATGIIRVLWQPDRDEPKQPNPEVAMGSERWVSLEIVTNLLEEIKTLRDKGFKIATTHLAANAIDFRQIDWTGSWVVVLGNEHRGCNDAILNVTDVNIVLPMVGFVQSLNVSVAAAVILYEIQRQREMAGFYNRVLPMTVVEELYKKWNLQEEGVSIDQLIEPPKDIPPLEVSHTDGRSRK